MITVRFESPLWLLLLLLLPWMWRAFTKRQHAALKFPQLKILRKISKTKNSVNFLNILRIFSVSALMLALARPQLGNVTHEREYSGIDIMIAVDVSSTMLALDMGKTNDFECTRINVAKSVIAEFIAKRPCDRIGLVIFAHNAYLLSPSTIHHDWLLQNLTRAHVGQIEDGTAIGSAITLSCNRLRNVEAKSKIIVLLTDGDDNASAISPVIASEAAAALGIKIYTIAVGTGGEVRSLYLNQHGKIATNIWGQPELVRRYFPVNAEMLQQVAERTHGRFFRAVDDRELRKIYDAIDDLEKTKIKIQEYARFKDIYIFLLISAMSTLFAEFILARTLLRRLP